MYSPEHKKQKQAAAAKRYAERHPDRVKKQKQKWYEKNREKELKRMAEWSRSKPELNFNGHLRRKYGLTRDQYDRMVLDQGGACAICKGPPIGRTSQGTEHKRFDVDHCHATGKVRGLLCHKCNVMLGQARDCTKILHAAILYLHAAE